MIDDRRSLSFLFHCCSHLGMSLFHRFDNDSLPADGETLTPSDQCCDPHNNNCKTPMHVWEARCPRCNGSGVISYVEGGSRRRSRRRLATCAACSGVGKLILSFHPDHVGFYEIICDLQYSVCVCVCLHKHRFAF